MLLGLGGVCAPSAATQRGVLRVARKLKSYVYLIHISPQALWFTVTHIHPQTYINDSQVDISSDEEIKIPNWRFKKIKVKPRCLVEKKNRTCYKLESMINHLYLNYCVCTCTCGNLLYDVCFFNIVEQEEKYSAQKY